MPRSNPYTITPINLSQQEETELRRRADRCTLPYFQDFRVVRAKMILLAAQGLPNDQIASRLATRREAVRMWRKRFFEEHLPGLEERSHPGRPRVFSLTSSFRSKPLPVSCLPLATRPFRLVEQVVTRPPCNDARRVFWVVDNGSSRRGNAAIAASRAAPEPGPRPHSCPSELAQPD